MLDVQLTHEAEAKRERLLNQISAALRDGNFDVAANLMIQVETLTRGLARVKP
jgi:hypothetical protein